MSFQVNKGMSKRFMYSFFKNYNSFFVFNVRDFQENLYLYNVFIGNVFHGKQLNKIFKKDMFFGLFAGNVFFCFVKSNKFIEVLLDLYYIHIKEKKLDLIGVCYNYKFFNFNINYSNIMNCLLLNFSIIFFLLLLFINLFLLKIVLVLKYSLFVKKC